MPGIELGGAIGLSFYFTNVVGVTVALAATTEVLMDSFGPDGRLVKGILPGTLQELQWFFLYASCINGLCFIIAIIGSKAFSKTMVFILVFVMISTVLTYGSFFLDKEVKVPYPTDCSYINGSRSCLTSEEGIFSGIANVPNWEFLSSNFINNLWPKYSYDCSQPGKHFIFTLRCSNPDFFLFQEVLSTSGLFSH